MVKFSKQLDVQRVPEWRSAYCQYQLLKKDLKLITFNWHLMPECPVAPSNPPFALTRRKSPWSSVDVIKPENTDLPVYYTELLAPVAPAAYLKRLFSSLDAELDKVNTLYKTKEEFLQLNLLVSMESGCLEKNQVLLDSIVEASCNGGSAFPDLNLDEDTVQGRELNDTGLKEGIIPVGALKGASMNKNLQTLEESSTMHLMKEIQELPVSTDPKDSVTQTAMLCAPSTMRSYRNEMGKC
ncbi:hypothetical protein BDL97_17G071600 [Sphagnum fallax]|nr:hypothetical protein BDL97_17G071600 [Sphagnum fallax]